MAEMKILNTREVKELFKLIEEQWGAKLKLEYGFLQNTKNRIFMINRDISKYDVSKLRVNNIGMYFCEHDELGLRLSIEGSQIIGPHSTKNVLDVDTDTAKRWFLGEDIETDSNGFSGFVILKHKNDYLGAGKFSKGKILNYVTKTRRISAV